MPTYDLIIKNGTVVDGSGLPRHLADIAIKDGRIVRKGRIGDSAAQVIDAKGKIVAPGFVDLHTHYDAQVLWDPLCTSSPWHGFTTAVIGNCGFTLAPCKPEDRAYLTGLLAHVESMSKAALQAGVDWRWETFPQYMDRLGSQALGINIAPQIGHSAMRRYVMGQEANRRNATDAEIARMKSMVKEAMDAGAWGFTTSGSSTHEDGTGGPVPSRAASEEETVELASVLAGYGVGAVETTIASADLMTRIALATGRPVNWNELSHSWDQPGQWRDQLDATEKGAAQGAQIFAIARCFRLDQVFSFVNVRAGIRNGRWPSWIRVFGESAERKKELLRDSDVRRGLRQEIDTLDPQKLPFTRMENMVLAHSTTGKYRDFEGKTVGDIARRVGKHPADVVIDWSLDEDLKTEFFFIGTRNGDEKAVAEMLRSPHCVPGLSDAGASISSFIGCHFSTHLLSYWVRERRDLTLEDAIRRLTFLPASVYGFRDRGLLWEGMAADVVIFDFERLAYLPQETVADFPAAQSRLTIQGKGYEYLIVNGRVTCKDGRPTGDLAGKVLRSNSRT